VSGVAVGSWACASPKVRRWAVSANATGHDSYETKGGTRLSRLAWLVVTGAAAAVVAGASASADHARAQPLAVLGLVAWACSLAILGLIDAEHFVLPTPILRLATTVTAVALVAAARVSGDWRPVLSAATTAAVAGSAYGAWALAKPEGLGFGDVRMAFLVAIGVGACSIAGALVALSCAPLAAGLVARCPGRRSPVSGTPLGPFLALAGVVGVVASAI
jgi:leader peptidase (prepilin peptidase) / N-methyltransferase